ncbi:MAG: ATP-binding cassette domain-containing protein [Methylococcales bacterium]
MKFLYELEDLQFSYGRLSVLNIDRLTIKQNTITALIGSNGAGKSTLLKLLAFLIAPNLGRIKFMGGQTDFRMMPKLRRRVGLVAQNPYLLRGLVLDNVTLGLKLRGVSVAEGRNIAMEALVQVNMASYAKRNVSTLSGGEAQKIALARILAYEPDVLLFDEPFTYLDQYSIVLIEEVIEKYRNYPGKSVIFSTHDKLHGLAIADSAISLVAGRSVGSLLMNLFSGSVRQNLFDTGKLSIELPLPMSNGSFIAIDPKEIVLSHNKLDSSLRNSYSGRIISIAEEAEGIRVSVDAGERFQALVTRQSMVELNLTVGQRLWIHFKSTAVEVF